MNTQSSDRFYGEVCKRLRSSINTERARKRLARDLRKRPHERPVIVHFRKFKDGSIIAIFPGIPGTRHDYSCLSYMHVGQHGACDVDIIGDTSRARPEEYAPLARELEGLGYVLDPRVRLHRSQCWWNFGKKSN